MKVSEKFPVLICLSYCGDTGRKRGAWREDEKGGKLFGGMDGEYEAQKINELWICIVHETSIWFACPPDVRRTWAGAMKCVTARPGKLLSAVVAISNGRTSRILSFTDKADVCRGNTQSAAHHSRSVWSLDLLKLEKNRSGYQVVHCLLAV